MSIEKLLNFSSTPSKKLGLAAGNAGCNGTGDKIRKRIKTGANNAKTVASIKTYSGIHFLLGHL